jgi:RNA polymerase sigma-70 factor (ECF subfamily)
MMSDAGSTGEQARQRRGGATDTGPAPEWDIISDAKKGDKVAWAVLYDELAPDLTRFFRDRGAPEPDNLLTESFLRLGQGIESFVGDLSKLRSDALLTAQDVLREKTRERSREDLGDTAELEDTESQRYMDAIESAKQGDEAAWSLLFDELAPDLTSYFRARGSKDAEDLISELFLRLARNIHTFEGGIPQFRAYAFTIAQNLLRDGARRSRTRPDLVFLEPTSLGGHRAGEQDPSAEDLAFHHLDLEGWQEVLGDLSGDQRHVLYLRVVADQTFEQVAAGVGKSTDAVKKLYTRALDRIRGRLDEEGGA